MDSGSDVVTIREEVLDSLDLELIGPIKSTGVHASRTKNLYRANMIIGNQTVEIEVRGLFLNASITTNVVCFSRLLKCLRSLYGKQCGPRLDCSKEQSVLGPRCLLLFLICQ